MKHLEDLAAAMHTAVDLECSAGHTTLAAAAAKSAAEAAERHCGAAVKAVEVCARHRDAISAALHAQQSIGPQNVAEVPVTEVCTALHVSWIFSATVILHQCMHPRAITGRKHDTCCLSPLDCTWVSSYLRLLLELELPLVVW